MVAFWPCRRDGDDVVLFQDETRSKEISRLYFLRQQIAKRAPRANMCLADFISPKADFAFVDIFEQLVIDAEPALHVRPEILDDDVGLFDQPLESRETLRRFQIERHAALVALKILEVGAFARTARPLAFREMRAAPRS